MNVYVIMGTWMTKDGYVHRHGAHLCVIEDNGKWEHADTGLPATAVEYRVCEGITDVEIDCGGLNFSPDAGELDRIGMPVQRLTPTTTSEGLTS